MQNGNPWNEDGRADKHIPVDLSSAYICATSPIIGNVDQSSDTTKDPLAENDETADMDNDNSDIPRDTTAIGNNPEDMQNGDSSNGEATDKQTDKLTPVDLVSADSSAPSAKIENADLSTTSDMTYMYPLHRACANGDLPTIKELVEGKAPINAKDLNGFSPLMTAASHGEDEVVVYLLANGASIQLRDWNFKTVLHFAVEEGHNSVIALLLEHGSGNIINSTDNYFQTALHYAARDGNVEALKTLCEDVGYLSKDRDGKSPLHIAAELGHLDCVKVLIEGHQYNIEEITEMQDYNLQTPLSLAVEAGRSEICEYLIAKGGNVSCLLLASTTHFVALFDVLIDSAESHEYDYSLVMYEIECIKSIQAVFADDNGELERWAESLVDSFQREILAKLQEKVYQTRERDNEVYTFLTHNITEGPLLRHRARQKSRKKKRETDIMQKLIEKAPDVARYALDKSIKDYIEVDGKKGKKEYRFGLVDAQQNRLDKRKATYFGPNIMRRNNRNDLLRHPVTLRLLKSKWAKLGLAMYLIGLGLYAVFLGLLTGMLVLDKDRQISSTVNGTRKHNVALTLSHQIVPWFTLCLVVIQIVVQTTRIVHMRWLFFTDVSTLLELVTYIAAVFFMVTFKIENIKVNDKYKNKPHLPGHVQDYYINIQDYKWQSGAIAILCGWATLLYYLKKIPKIGVYVDMFEEVFLTVMRVLTSLFFLIIAFAFSFFVLMEEKKIFHKAPTAIMKTVMWLFGEFNYDEVFVNPPPKYGATLVVFIVFLIIMPILYMNLLVGLAVGDIDQVRNSAVERNFTQQVVLVNTMNQSLPSWLLTRLYQASVIDDPTYMTVWERIIEWFVDLEKDEQDEEELERVNMLSTFIDGVDNIHKAHCNGLHNPTYEETPSSATTLYTST